jgi:hypothetical protein
MKLSDFEEYFEDVILTRGKDYYSHGRIEKIEEIDNNDYIVEVEGTEYYTVRITMADSDKIVDTSCDCPYDWGDYCKHQAAALFALRSRTTKQKKSTTTGKKADLKAILSNLPKAELINIILDISKDYREIDKRLMFKYTSGKDKIANSKKLIKEYINKTKYRGLIEWRNVDEAVQGAEITLEEAYEKMKDGEIKTAVLLCITILSTVVEMLEYCDDSSGVVGAIIEQSLAIIDEASLAAINLLNENQQKELFNAIFEEALNERYREWIELRIRLLGICIYFSKNENLRIKLEQQLNRMLKGITNHSWQEEYEIENIKRLQLELIEQHDGKGRALQFIMDNIQFSPFREKAIAFLFEKEKYQEVIQLCKDGEELDREYGGLVQKWKKYRLQAYEELGDIRGQRKLMLEFLYNNEHDYYLKLKKLYQPDEWREIQEEILDTFRNQSYPPSAYLKILKIENMKEELLEYCRAHLSSIQDLYPFLMEDYFEEVNELFIKYIEMEAEQARDRRKYKNVCSMIQTYKKACGEVQAQRVINQLKQKYQRRPAFIDELGKLK